MKGWLKVGNGKAGLPVCRQTRKCGGIQRFVSAVLLAGLLFWLLFLRPGSAAAEIMSSTELVERCQFYDGKAITFRGEVVGDAMIRGESAWINANDDAYSEGSRRLSGYNSGQSIWCRTDDAKLIETVGDYRHVGDIVEVRGVFNRACPEHGGDMDIHASEVHVVKRGRSIPHPVEIGKIRATSILFAISLALFVSGRALRWRRLRGETPEA